MKTESYKKILVLRFSSIGDIVLTSPVLRVMKQQMPQSGIHFVCKEVFADTLKHNPHVDRLYTFKRDIEELWPELLREKYDIIIDLHNNLRSRLVKNKLGVKTMHFPKINWQKFVAVNFKKISVLPAVHIVERYFQAVAKLGLKPDGKGLEYFIDTSDAVDMASMLAQTGQQKFIALVLGGSYATKQIPLEKLAEICALAKLPLVLLGDKNDAILSAELHRRYPHTINLCGSLTLNQSASVLQQAEWVISGDTGLMHIASAFQKKIISLWGNTIPEFGMSPYMPHPLNQLWQVKDLSCRPCSKLGYHACPLKHFNCMQQQDVSAIGTLL